MPYIFGNVGAENFLHFKEIIDNSKFNFYEIKYLYYFKSNRWDIMTKNGLTIKMPFDLTETKLNLIYKIIKKNNFNDTKIIDFRQNNLMVVNE